MLCLHFYSIQMFYKFSVYSTLIWGLFRSILLNFQIYLISLNFKYVSFSKCHSSIDFYHNLHDFNALNLLQFSLWLRKGSLLVNLLLALENVYLAVIEWNLYKCQLIWLILMFKSSVWLTSVYCFYWYGYSCTEF